MSTVYYGVKNKLFFYNGIEAMYKRRDIEENSFYIFSLESDGMIRVLKNKYNHETDIYFNSFDHMLEELCRLDKDIEMHKIRKMKKINGNIEAVIAEWKEEATRYPEYSDTFYKFWNTPKTEIIR